MKFPTIEELTETIIKDDKSYGPGMPYHRELTHRAEAKRIVYILELLQEERGNYALQID